MSRVLSAPLEVRFDYTRSLGPVLTGFFTGLRDQVVHGVRTADGRVVVPPVEFDPVTHQPLTELVAVADTGTVLTWTWVSDPVAGQPFDRPFAYALVHLDGADTPLLHAVDAPHDQMHTEMRVRARWVEEPRGQITDIAAFEPALDSDDTQDEEGAATEARVERRPAVTGIVTPVDLDFLYEASAEESAFFRGLAQGRLLGQRCPRCGKVYVPPRSACPVDGVPTTDEIELPDTGIVTTFCIVNVPFLGQRITPPYVSAYVLLDGADIAFLHLIQGIDAHEVRMGMRVRAVWKPRADWGTTIENIEHFEPTGEPDAPFESFAVHL